MDRFVAMIWDEQNQGRLWQVNQWSEALSRRSPRWVTVLDRPGFRVLSYVHRGDSPVVTYWDDGDGIVIGTLFERGCESYGRVHRLEMAEVEQVIKTRGEKLIRDYWGNYVALWRDKTSLTKTVLRDPCGATPCFVTEQRGVQMCFAHADDVADLQGLQFTVDWQFVRAFVHFNYFVTRHTGLIEISDLLPGERYEAGARGEHGRSWAWDGAAISGNPVERSPDELVEELKAVTGACCLAWGKSYDNIVVRMSGGLDSSILATLMRKVSNAAISGVHFLGEGYEAAEAKKARLAAEHAGVSLVELNVPSKPDDFRRILSTPRLPRPTRQILSIAADDLTTALAVRLGVDAFIVGHGGDNLFLQRSGTKNVVIDYLRSAGLGRDLLDVVYDSAILQGRSAWSILWDLIRSVASAKRWDPYPFLLDGSTLEFCPLREYAIASLPPTLMRHPWFERAARLSPGKADHLSYIVALNHYYTTIGHGLRWDVLMPFYSQPIVEFCLRTPTYEFTRGGIDRALERKAFRDLIPGEIARRSDKGTYALQPLEELRSNLPFIRDLLLDGEIASQPWIDRIKLEHLLTPDHMVHGGGAAFIDHLVVAQAWLSSWRNRTYDARHIAGTENIFTEYVPAEAQAECIDRASH